MTEMGLFEAMYSARSLRRFRPDPVPEALVTRILDAAIRAPSAGNAQNWAFIVVRDPAQRARIGAVYRKGSDIAAAVYAARSRPAHLTEAQWARMLDTGAWLWEHMAEVPVLLVPCLRQRDMPPAEALPREIAARHGEELAYLDRIRGASIYPALQNIILACRAFGLGTVITTNHLRCEAEFNTVLGLPEDVHSFALMPIGYPLDRHGPLSRRPVEEVAHADRWSAPWPGGSG
ncbi:nitroreductase family protein [Paracraurococcus lichenis]|uniref:Nitroreductase family protein n=1 Tax=Paracraurococcus lichenis TaxID=3064888 RepID=A0ABT9DZU6_9PROT|nr:nitroreductase family protein [Paracraurococcus sp. LOR1-02]MDO9709426.1 nitroreductase family protein [Paracraurococcus sp. LOR1-02]